MLLSIAIGVCVIPTFFDTCCMMWSCDKKERRSKLNSGDPAREVIIRSLLTFTYATYCIQRLFGSAKIYILHKLNREVVVCPYLLNSIQQKK